MKLPQYFVEALFLLAVAGLSAQAARKAVTVSTVDQLIKAIAPNTEIALKPGNYDLAAGSAINGEFASWRSAGGGLSLLRCFRILYDGCWMSGPGSVGIWSIDASRITFVDFWINDCSRSALHLKNSSSVYFLMSSFLESSANPLVEIEGDCRGIAFMKSDFDGNSGEAIIEAEYPNDLSEYFFWCDFRGNEVGKWSRSLSGVNAVICEFEENAFATPIIETGAGSLPRNGLAGAIPAYYMHMPSGLAFLYPFDWSLDIFESEKCCTFAAPESETALQCLLLRVGEPGVGQGLGSDPDAAFDAAYGRLAKMITEKFRFQPYATAVGTAQGEGALPFKEYSGSLRGQDATIAMRLRIYCVKGEFWALCLTGENAESIREGSKADLILREVGCFPLAE